MCILIEVSIMKMCYFFVIEGSVFIQSYSGRNKGVQSGKHNQPHISRGVSCTCWFSCFFTNCFSYKTYTAVRYGFTVYVLLFLDLQILIIKAAVFLLELVFRDKAVGLACQQSPCLAQSLAVKYLNIVEQGSVCACKNQLRKMV